MLDSSVKKPLVIYHKGCNDGFGASWVLQMVYPEADFYDAYHGTNPPDSTGRDVIMVDFAYPRAMIEEIRKVCKSFILIDHHVTAQEDLQGIPDCYFDLTKSAARLTFDKLVEWNKLSGSIPPLILYVEDRDLNKWKLPDTREINAALTSNPMTFDSWSEFNQLLCDNPDLIISQGKSILRFQSMLVDSIVARAREVVLDSYQILASNASVLWGDVAERLASNRPFGLAWYRREDGKYIYSLRSDDSGVDVSAIAKKWGGGGHPHQSGICLDRLLV